MQPRQATANPVDGKACSSTKGGLLRYIPNTYSIHKVSSLKFAYFQGRLSRYICIFVFANFPIIHVYMSRSMRKPDFWLGENKGADQLCSYAQLISPFVFTTWIVQFSLLWLYRVICVGPDRNPRRLVFLCRGSYNSTIDSLIPGR